MMMTANILSKKTESLRKFFFVFVFGANIDVCVCWKIMYWQIIYANKVSVGNFFVVFRCSHWKFFFGQFFLLFLQKPQTKRNGKIDTSMYCVLNIVNWRLIDDRKGIVKRINGQPIWSLMWFSSSIFAWKWPLIIFINKFQWMNIYLANGWICFAVKLSIIFFDAIRKHFFQIS